MQRVTLGRSATISVLFEDQAGAPVDPAGAAVTVTIVRDDGSPVVAAAAAAHAGTGEYSYVLTPAQTATVDVLSASWTGTINGNAETIVTTVEVCGGPLVALSALESLMGDGFTTDQLTDARLLAELTLEDLCGVAFTTRYRREVLSGEGRGHRDLLLPTPRVTALRSVAIAGTALTVDELAAVTVLEGEGALRAAGFWQRGAGNIEVCWEHGYRQTFPLAARPVMLLAERLLLADNTGLSNRATSLTNDAGTQLLIVAGVRGMATDIPEVNAFIQDNSSSFGFA